MPLINKVRAKKSAKVTLVEQTPESVIPQQPVPKRRGRPKKVQPIEPSAPTTAEPPSEFPVGPPKKARKPRAIKKENTELVEQLPVKTKKQKVQVEVEIDPIITTKPARKPRLTKAQKNKQIFEEEASASEEQSEAEEDEEDEEDSDQELDRCIERLAKIKQLQE